MGGKFLFILILVSFSYLSAYADPPVNEVDAHNMGIAGGLMGTEKLSLGTLTNEEPAKVNMSIVSAMPQVDDRIPSDVEGILWAWNEKNADGQTLTHEDAGIFKNSSVLSLSMVQSVLGQPLFSNITN